MKQIIIGALLFISGIALYALTPPSCVIAGAGAGVLLGAGFIFAAIGSVD